MDAQSKSVVVIGAGIAGLAAAARLLKAGVQDVTLLEASDRVGGRINSINFRGSELEIGAQWVHGEDGNVVYQVRKGGKLPESSHLQSDLIGAFLTS